MPLAPGTRLGTYEIVGPLGAGGMGEVYRAQDTRLGRDVAIKVLSADVASSADRLARFEREARAVAGLNHPNIVTLFSVEEEDGIRFLTMELIEGQSLSELVVPGGLPVSRILDLSIPLADALAAAHERGVIHRDLKPGNVMVTREGRLKVLDFGLAKLAGAASDSHQPQAATMVAPISVAGQLMGTVPYMAPEQLRGEDVDARSDLFAFGIILYELATGRRPFTGETRVDLGHAIMRDMPERLTQIRTGLPVDLERIVSRCLEKNPRERAQSALDLSNELRRLRRDLVREDGGKSGKAASENVASIAVLPFVNRSRDEEDEYFSDGLADELLNMLAKIRGLKVAARSSAFTFKGKQVTVYEAGNALNVATVLEGSVRKAGNRVRVSVQLVNVSDGYHLWSETYDRTLEDIFAVQDDIARSVVHELRAALLGEESNVDGKSHVSVEVARAARGRGQSAEAHRLALQGRHMIERLTKDDFKRGIRYLSEALQLDPNKALAWVDLSRAHLNAAGHGWEPMEEGVAMARAAAERALAIEPDLPEGHVVLGRLRLYFDWDWEGAKESYRRAMELAPGNAVGVHGAGILAQNEGRIEEALNLYRLAVDQDPLSAGAYDRLGITYLAAGLFSEAEAAFRKVVELSPQRIQSHARLAFALLAQGHADEALAEVEKECDDGYRLLALVAIHHAGGRMEASNEALRGLIDRGSTSEAFQIAEAHAARNEIDAAFVWLDRAHAQRDPGLTEINCSYLLRSLHDDPRWSPFLKKMGLVD
jgi:eukaryotic-like serine/threonine-protein kinase